MTQLLNKLCFMIPLLHNINHVENLQLICHIKDIITILLIIQLKD